MIVRAEGAIPATTAIINGRLKVGLSEEELMFMCNPKDVGKVSRRDIATYIATGKAGATTVASTMMLAGMAGIKVFATGGIGGVHRGGEDTSGSLLIKLTHFLLWPVVEDGAKGKLHHRCLLSRVWLSASYGEKRRGWSGCLPTDRPAPGTIAA